MRNNVHFGTILGAILDHFGSQNRSKTVPKNVMQNKVHFGTILGPSRERTPLDLK